MMFTSAPLYGTPNELCDWIELSAWISANGWASLNELNSDVEIEEDFEPEDLAGENEINEGRIQRTMAVLDDRTRSMPSSYPFVLEGSSGRVVLKSKLSPGAIAYLFCLIVSSAATDGPLSGDGPWTPDLKSARNLFQTCATVCLAGWAQGHAYSVGWPRPDSSRFVDKLLQVYKAFGDGKPHPTKPAWAPPHVKDDSIDVIAWKHEPDGLPGTFYALAQIASGANWDGKSIKGAVDVFHQTWFLQQPASPATPVLAIPFTIPSPSEATDHESQEQLAGSFHRTIVEMGALLFRARVAHYVDVGVTFAQNPAVVVEQLDALPKVEEYVSAYREQVRAYVSSVQ